MSKTNKIKIILPSDPTIKDSNGIVTDQMEFVSVNGKNYLIRCDEEVEVPPEVYEVIQNKIKARAETRQLIKAKAFKEPPKA